jgi:hypothetical protein
MMHQIRTATAAAVVCLLLATALVPTPGAQGDWRGAIPILARSTGDIRQWTPVVDGMLRAGELRLRPRRPDLVMGSRRHDRADQYHQGVRVFGGDLVVQTERARVLSIFGTLHRGLDVQTTPAIDETAALAAVERHGAEPQAAAPELVVLPRDAGLYALAWRIRATRPGDIRQYFVDARTGAVILDYTDVKDAGPDDWHRDGRTGGPEEVERAPGQHRTVRRRGRTTAADPAHLRHAR